MTKIKGSRAEVIFTGDWEPDAGNFLKQARNLGVKLPFANLYMDHPSPLSAVGPPFPSLFDSPIASAGLYIWTIPLKGQEGELVYYVGETGRPFPPRMVEHVESYLSCEYGINDPAILQEGKRFRIWEGLWRGAKIQDFLDRYEELSGEIMELLHLYRLYLLPLTCDAKMRKRIEGGIVLEAQGGLKELREEIPSVTYTTLQ